MDATSIASRPRAARLSETPIAIIGMSAILPESENLSRYWQNIVDELDCIRDVPPDRWKIADLYDPDSKAPDKTYSKRGGFIPEIAFDPMEFGLPPNILEVTDVSQLLALVAAREVLKDAGYADEKSFDRDRMGVTLGVGGGQKLYTPLTSRLQYPIWKEVLVKSGVSEADAEAIISKIKKAHIPWEENSFPGMLGNVIAGRVANRFNLGGTNCVLDAACGGALAAVKMAVSELVEHRADIMITGGVDTDNSPFMYLCFSKTPAMTPDEYCSPFDEGSRGILISEGIGMLALKRLADAERDGDRVYAVIRGLGTSSDGKFKSIYAPRPEGQAKALRRAYQDADISPNTLGLIEAHATGTPAGDLSEFTALKQVFGECGAEMQSIAVGSVKSQIGHTKTAAGAAGLIKAALALHHKVLPATLHVSRPNPKLDVPNSPFYVNTETRPWVRSNGTPRRAGVSAFGFGGTNFHFVLEEYEKAAEKPFRIHGKNRAALICADTPQILLNRMNDLVARLSSPEGERAFSDLWQASRSLSIPPDSARVGLVADSAKKAAELLCAAVKALSESPEKEAFSLPQGVHYRVRALSGKVCALFSGQGSQYVNMGRGAALSFPPVHEMFGKADHLFSEHGLAPLSEAVYPRPVFSNDEKSALERALSGTRLAQPAIGALSAGFFEVFRKSGFSPDFFAGHSFGELSALWAAGAISLDDFLNLARIRGEAMALAPKPGHDPGKMAAILASASDIAEICALFPNVVTANYNGPRQTVIAGPTPDLDACCEMLSGRGFKAVPLPVSAAFHSPCVAHAKEPFAQAVSAVSFNENCARVFSNTLAGPYPKNPEEAKRLLCNHILNPVRFTDEVEAMYAAGARIFVEFGPRDILKRMVSDILGARPHLALAVDARGRDGDAALREAWAAMKVAGLPLADADPWAAPPDQQEAKPGRAAVRLTGANYVSEKTRKAYQDSVNDGFTVGAAKKAGEGKDRKMEAYADTVTSKALNNAVFTTLPPHGTQPPCPAASPPVRDTAAQQVFQASAAPVGVNPAVERIPGVNSAMPLSRLENVLDQFISHQRQTTGAHEKFLDNNSEYIKAVFGLLSDQAALLSKNGNGSNVPDVLSRGMDAFHGVWADTVRVHGRFLEEESNNGRLWLYAASGQDARTAPVARALPTQPIPAISARAGSLPAPSPSPVPVYEAPAQAVIKPAAPAPSSAPEVLFPVSPKLKAAQPEPPKAPTPSTPAPVADLSGAFLEVVSEKTGYPVSMLELSMDMEADLGIDSIKRVEILGAMRERFPHLPELEAAELAELKTLGQVAS
ncbi:MAG: acyltransferase domain-containing protein, partial [Deltaproteobacteria bacterium]|nr:acyltransferase domain-containing protein [Deltaproteobacteria bacterium]